MDETAKLKLKTMINAKYVLTIVGDLASQDVSQDASQDASQDYVSKGIDLRSPKSDWDAWLCRHGIVSNGESTQQKRSYVKLDGGIADGFLLVPEDFALKALVLGHLPD